MRLILNAAVELEEHEGAGQRFDPLGPGSDGSFVPLGVGSAERAAVLGASSLFRVTSLGPDVNTADDDLSPAVSADGLTLLFSSDRPGGVGGTDLYMATRASTSEPFADVVSLGAGVNTASNETAPALSADGLTLYFGSDRPDGFGSTDLYMATRATTSDPFGDVTNLGADVNTASNDNNPTISADGLMLLFNSNRPGVGWSGHLHGDPGDHVRPVRCCRRSWVQPSIAVRTIQHRRCRPTVCRSTSIRIARGRLVDRTSTWHSAAPRRTVRPTPPILGSVSIVPTTSVRQVSRLTATCSSLNQTARAAREIRICTRPIPMPTGTASRWRTVSRPPWP